MSEIKEIIWKRCAVIFSIVLLVGTVSYTIFNCVNVFADSFLKREIAREVQKIKEKGEPTTIEELIPEEIPDEENGALVYRQAFKLKRDLENKYKTQWQYVPYEGSKVWEEVPEEEKETVRNLLLYNSDFQRFYQVLERASSMKCQFLARKDYEKGAALLLPHLRILRSCCRLLSAKAKLQGEKGAIDEALDTCLTSLKIDRSLSNEPLLISQLVRNALGQISLAALENVLEKGEGSEDLYQALIEEISNERKLQITYLGLLGERTVFGMQELRRLRKSGAEMRAEERKKVLEKLFELQKKQAKDLEEAFFESPETFLDNQELCYLRTMAKMISLSEEPYWQVMQKLEVFEKEVQKLPKEKAILTQAIVPALNRAYYQEAKLDALLGVGELALACHVYKAKYGDYPSSLKELTPGILSSLPLDPFTGKNYIFRRERKGFTVYSVGANLKDDGGISHKEKGWKGDYDIVWERDG